MTTPSLPKRKERINPDLISLAHRPHIFVKVVGESYRMQSPGLSKNEDGAITVYPVEDLETGEVGLLMGNTVLEKTLAAIPSGYVGKSFEIEASDPREGKKYRDVKVWTLED